ncbi:hypothetical protein Gotri_000430 [Gossypium trilobum]|uniref:COBRA C-terminal domain-containing protein n=1 Tax=Gossypium trilobum TaxID=34281 RepID=A0A7J9FBC5_9ROSI|nr:hypothetical protein [Gossypium trilobum]
MGWDWTGDEVIWAMQGAEATEQGNCSRFKGGQLPHCCEKSPFIVDLLPGAPFNMQTTNCCKGGILSSMIQDPSKFGAVFQMSTSAATDESGFHMPENFTIGVPGYTCAKPVQVAPSKYSSDGGRRWTQALAPLFLVQSAAAAAKDYLEQNVFGETPSLLQQIKDSNRESPSLVRCSQHMCPIRVHWHVKQSYTHYWRVKITVNNLNILKNYSQWNLVALHPNLKSLIQVFSFNYEPLNQYGQINDTGIFWGIEYYNDMLLQEGESGNVQTEMLLLKDPDMFTFREGWGFPRRILFNGDECVMPPPDQYPSLPNTAQLEGLDRGLTSLQLNNSCRARVTTGQPGMQ